MITARRNDYLNDLYFCKDCKVQLPLKFNHDASHNIVPLEWIIFCENCNSMTEKNYNYCPNCGQHFSDW